MPPYPRSGTIFAPATALAESAIGVLRMSGPAAWAIARAWGGGLPGRVRARRAYVVKVAIPGARAAGPPTPSGLDRGGKVAAATDSMQKQAGGPRALQETAVLTLFRAPRSYTGEDMAEL